MTVSFQENCQIMFLSSACHFKSFSLILFWIIFLQRVPKKEQKHHSGGGKSFWTDATVVCLTCLPPRITDYRSNVGWLEFFHIMTKTFIFTYQLADHLPCSYLAPMPQLWKRSFTHVWRARSWHGGRPYSPLCLQLWPAISDPLPLLQDLSLSSEDNEWQQGDYPGRLFLKCHKQILIQFILIIELHVLYFRPSTSLHYLT